MFFSVATCPDYRFTNHYEHQGLWISLDSGWERTDCSWRKGYKTNNCELVLTDNSVQIRHSEPRSFPLWFEHTAVTNLYTGLGKQCWANGHLEIKHTGQVEWQSNPLDLTVPSGRLDTTQALQQLQHQLDLAVAELDQPVQVFCTGGLDTFLIYSMLVYHDREFDLLEQEHFEADAFVDNNRQALAKHWSYQRHQLHHWCQPTWLATGGCGDEYSLRGPAVIAMLTAWHDINFGELLATSTTQYHYHHFNRYQDLWQTAWQERDQLRQQYPTRDLLNQQIMNHLLNDHQHWHLGETITWTPFKNIELVRILLQCDITDLVPQFLDGALTKQLIAHYCPKVLDFVSTYKNHNNQEKLAEFYTWHYHA